MATYELINTTTLSATTQTITVSSIPATYTDLYVWINPFLTAGGYFDVRFNSNSGSIYTQKVFRNDSGGGDSYGSQANATNFYIQGLSASTSGVLAGAASKIYIGNYANTSYNKATLADSGAPTYTAATDYKQVLTTGNFGSNTAISSISIINAASSFDVGTVISVYGIKNT